MKVFIPEETAKLIPNYRPDWRDLPRKKKKQFKKKLVKFVGIMVALQMEVNEGVKSHGKEAVIETLKEYLKK
jgi:hypothetical protein